MNEQYDPAISYDLIDAEDIKVGEVRRGKYFEKDWEAGYIEDAVFHYNGQPAGKVDGLIVTRDDKDGSLTQLRLVPHKSV